MMQRQSAATRGITAFNSAWLRAHTQTQLKKKLMARGHKMPGIQAARLEAVAMWIEDTFDNDEVAAICRGEPKASP